MTRYGMHIVKQYSGKFSVFIGEDPLNAQEIQLPLFEYATKVAYRNDPTGNYLRLAFLDTVPPEHSQLIKDSYSGVEIIHYSNSGSSELWKYYKKTGLWKKIW